MNVIAPDGTIFWSDASVLITGRPGSFGNKFVELMLERFQPRRLVVFSRDELKLAPSAVDIGLIPLSSRGLFHVREGGSYNFPGASYCMPLPEAFADLPRASLKDFPMDPFQRTRFVPTFLGFDDTRRSESFLDLVAGRSDRP